MWGNHDFWKKWIIIYSWLRHAHSSTIEVVHYLDTIMALYVAAPLCSCSSFLLYLFDALLLYSIFATLQLISHIQALVHITLYVNYKAWWRCLLIYSTIMIVDKCAFCNNRQLAHSMNTECNSCHYFAILNVSYYPLNISKKILDDPQHWLCHLCLASIFPLNCIEDNREFFGAIDNLSNKDTFIYISEKCS